MNISQVAQLVGLTAKQIRDYEKYGLIAPSGRTASNYRAYSKQDIEKLHFIAHARDVGFSLAQIAELLYLKANPSALPSCQVKALTASHIDEISLKIENLQKMKSTLQSWHDGCDGNVAECSILRALESPIPATIATEVKTD